MNRRNLGFGLLFVFEYIPIHSVKFWREFRGCFFTTMLIVNNNNNAFFSRGWRLDLDMASSEGDTL